MLFTQEELGAQKTTILTLKEQIEGQIAHIQKTLQDVEKMKAALGNMQVQLIVEERLLARMVGTPPKETKDGGTN